MQLRLFPALAAFASLILLSTNAKAQSMARDTLDPWTANDLAETYDHPILELGGHVENQSHQDTNMFHWDSYGKVRINREDQDAPFFAYRVLFIDAADHSETLRSSMDEFDLAMGYHLGQLGDWDMSTVLGLGYSSTHPFRNTDGIFGIGHILGQHHFDDENSLVLSFDYEGNSSLLPDVPLPGFAILHHTDNFDFMFGYPMSSARWRPIEKLEFTASYTVPYTADIDVEYRVAKHFGLYGDAGNFYQGFYTERGDHDNRQFFQMRRAEMGVRVIYDPWVDASLGIGYAFDQGFDRGFDIRDIHGVGHISNEPYLAIVVHGRF